MSVRSLLSLLLFAWLFLSIARLVFDLIGKLWLAACFDLLQIVCCLVGLFGSLQKRRCLLYALLCSNLISITQNVLIFLWYIGIFGDISRSVLSAGLPYQFSFFLKYTPGCESHFDLMKKIWVQNEENCLLPYHIIEAIQSVFHIVLAVVTSILTILVIIETKKKPIRSSNQSINHYAQICASKIGNTPSSINDSSSGYINSTYDDLRSQTSSKGPVERGRREIKGQFERNSKRKKAGKHRPNSMPAPDSAPCSSSKSSEEDGHIEDVYTKPIKKKSTSLVRSIESTEDERDRPTTVTSLVSFDPKSATLLRIRQHLEAEPSDRETPDSETAHGLYERLRSRSSGSDMGPTSTIPLSDYKSRNASQDSVPSMFAPMLDSPAPSSTSSRSSGASKKSNGLILSAPITSPGIRLSDQLGAYKPPYKSAFRVQSKDTRIIGHYHSPNEIPLSSDPSVIEESPNYPVMTHGGLLV